MADGLSLDPPEFDPGPLVVRGQVHIDSGTNIATVTGLTPGAFSPVNGPVFFGLNVAGPAAPFFMTSTQATAALNLFTTTLQGLVPASGGGTTNFLRADGTWAPPPPGGASAVTGAIAHAAGGGASTFAGIRDNGTAENDRTNLNFLSGTNTTASVTDDAGNDELEIRWDWNGLQARRNSGTLLTARRRFNFIEGTSISITVNSDAADDENEVTIAYNGVIPGAVNGAITHAAGGGASTFSGIRDNGASETARTNLDFVSTPFDTVFTLTQNPGLDSIDVRVSTLGSFYSENDVGSIQTKFISFDDGLGIDANVVDNTGGSGFINVSFDLSVWAEPSSTSTGTLDDVAINPRSIFRLEGNGPVVTGIDDATFRVGDLVAVNCQGTHVDLLRDTGSTSSVGHRFRIANLSSNQALRLATDEVAVFLRANLSSGAPPTRHFCISHRAPFCNTNINGVGDTLVHNGVDWIAVHKHFDEEFLGSPGSFMSAQQLVGAWSWVSDGNGVYQALISEASHAGIVQLNTTGTSGDTLRAALGGTIGTDGTDYASQFVLGDIAFFRFIVRIPSDSSLSNANYGIGFANAIGNAEIQGTTPNLGGNGLILHKNTGQTAWNMRRETASGAVIALGPRTAALGDWIECIGINNGSGSWSFTMNGVAFSAGLSGVSTSALVRPVFFLHQTAAGTRKLDVDKFEFGLRFQASRFTA